MRAAAMTYMELVAEIETIAASQGVDYGGLVRETGSFQMFWAAILILTVIGNASAEPLFAWFRRRLP